MATTNHRTTNHRTISGYTNPDYAIVKHIMIDIKIEPEDLNTTEWTIYKVPCNLRSLNESAYTPQLVSIGPLHYGKEKLNDMQKQKLRYLKFFCNRGDHVKNNMSRFKEHLKKNEPQIRHCYAGKLCDDIDKEKLVEILLLDSVFIMELFLRIQGHKPDEEERKNNNHGKKQANEDEQESKNNSHGTKQTCEDDEGSKKINHDGKNQTNEDDEESKKNNHRKKQACEDDEESKKNNDGKKQTCEDDEESKNNNDGKKQKYEDDIIVKQPWLNKSIQRDLLLLENQIPLFILQWLYNEIVPNSDPDKKRPTFVELAHDYFESYHTYKKAESCSNQEASSSCFNGCGEPAKQNNDGSSGSTSLGKLRSLRFEQLKENWEDPNYEPIHFTDLLRSFYMCKGLTHFKKACPLKTATKLRESGVSFDKVINRPLVDIKFKKVKILSRFLCLGCFPNSSIFKARLQIPELKVDDTTECVLRNLIAFEQCHYPNKPYICNYVSFIDSLIHTKDDVELLVEKEVIVHELGSDTEVATLVNGLCKYVVTDKTCYAEIIKSLNKHYLKQWNRAMAALRLVYFRDTWRASSTLVGILVLAFTIFNFCRVVRLVLDLDRRNRP